MVFLLFIPHALPFAQYFFSNAKKACGFSSATKGKFFSALQNERKQEERNCEKLKPIEKKKFFYISQLHSFHVLCAANILHTDKRLIMSTACITSH